MSVENEFVYIVMQCAGTGQIMQFVCAYKSENDAIEHIQVAKILMPFNCDTIKYTKVSILNEFLE